MSGIKIISKNRQAHHEYFLEETFEAGKQAVRAAVNGETDKMVCYARKEGDYVRIDNSDGSYFFYYIGENSDDYDWKRAARETIALEEYDKAFADRVEKNFNAEKASEKSIAAAWKHAYDIMKPYVEERKQLNGLK